MTTESKAFMKNFSRRALVGGGVGLIGAATIAATTRQLDEKLNHSTDRLSLQRRPEPMAEATNAGAIAASKGLFFGSAISIQPLRRDSLYRALHTEQCNIFVHASALMWHELQGGLGSPYNFADAEAIYAYGAAHGKSFRGHMMLDMTGLPPGLREHVATLTPNSAESLLTKHVRRLASHWRGRFIEWNVVNEPICGDVCAKSPWLSKLGEQYIDIAFAAAHQSDASVRLSINQNMVEMDERYQNMTRNSTLELIQRLKSRGVPVSAVGIEGHLRSGSPVDQNGLDWFVRELAKLGVAFFVSELDVDDRKLNDDINKRDAESAALVRDFLDVMLAQRTCLGLIYWQLNDGANWMLKRKKYNRSNGALQRPCPFDGNYKPKPMWDVTLNALRRAPGPGSLSILPKSPSSKVVE